MGEMFVKGVNTAKVGEVIETLTGSHPSSSTVSRVFHTLESEYEQWKQRPLAERYEYAFADGTYFTVIYNDEGCKMPILAVAGIALLTVNHLSTFWEITSAVPGSPFRVHAAGSLVAHNSSRHSPYRE